MSTNVTISKMLSHGKYLEYYELVKEHHWLLHAFNIAPIFVVAVENEQLHAKRQLIERKRQLIVRWNNLAIPKENCDER